MIALKNAIRCEVQTLCESCRWSGVVQFHNRNLPMIRCDQLGRTVASRVDSCTYYIGKNQMTLFEMEQSAWLVKNGGDQIGFVRPGTKEHEEMTDASHPNRPARAR